MIIAMPIVRMMQASVYEITNMITMRNSLVSTSRPMNMAAVMIN